LDYWLLLGFRLVFTWYDLVRLLLGLR